MARTTARIGTATYPLASLRLAAAELEAAVLACMVKPGKKPVHELRTSTRRIEATLELLEAAAPHLPHGERLTRKLRRLLRKLRRAAGSVRDLGVQRTLIDEVVDRNSAPRSLLKEAKYLRRELKHRGGSAAKKLSELLKKIHRKLVKALDALLEASSDAESLALSERELIALVRHWYSTRTQPLMRLARDGHAEQVHSIRKIAKLARYFAETAPPAARAAHRLAACYEALQQAGGNWHDLLLLSEIAQKELGGTAKLPHQLDARSKRALQNFQRRFRHKF